MELNYLNGKLTEKSDIPSDAVLKYTLESSYYETPDFLRRTLNEALLVTNPPFEPGFPEPMEPRR